MRRILIAPIFSAALVLSTGLALADEQAPTQKKPQAQEQLYGSQLMTREERTEFRTKMRAAKTAEEREQIRKEHHEKMKERAKERGVTLPEEPPAMGRGMGGGGMGPGGKRAQHPIYGSQLMTRQERVEFRAKMRAAKSAEEREQIRKEHHEKMKERAKERGVTLPDEPPAMGGGMGAGGGMGPGGGRDR